MFVQSKNYQCYVYIVNFRLDTTYEIYIFQLELLITDINDKK